MEQMSLVDALRDHRKIMLVTAAEAAAYRESWGDKYVAKKVQQAWYDTRASLDLPARKYPLEDFKKLTDSELSEFNFLRFETRQFTKMVLIPLWVWNLIEDGTVLTSISGKTFTKGVDRIDLDNLGGAIAWGWVIDEPTEEERTFE